MQMLALMRLQVRGAAGAGAQMPKVTMQTPAVAVADVRQIRA